MHFWIHHWLSFTQEIQGDQTLLPLAGSGILGASIIQWDENGNIHVMPNLHGCFFKAPGPLKPVPVPGTATLFGLLQARPAVLDWGYYGTILHIPFRHFIGKAGNIRALTGKASVGAAATLFWRPGPGRPKSVSRDDDGHFGRSRLGPLHNYLIFLFDLLLGRLEILLPLTWWGLLRPFQDPGGLRRPKRVTRTTTQFRSNPNLELPKWPTPLAVLGRQCPKKGRGSPHRSLYCQNP